MAIMEICAKCGEEYNSDKWVNGAGTCQDCACDAMELENAALRARVVKHEPDCMSIVNPTFGEGQTACTCGADLKPAHAPRCPHCGYGDDGSGVCTNWTPAWEVGE